MENIARLTSWAFVFGALATLLFTSLRPVWKDLSSVDVNVEQVQGTVADVDAIDPPVKAPIAQADCLETPTAEGLSACGDRGQ